MSDNNFWFNFWVNKGDCENDFEASAWSSTNLKGFLYDIDDIIKKLRLEKTDKLLNIGAGPGLMEIILNNLVSEIDCVDYSDKLISKAKENNKNYCNVNFYTGNLFDLSFLQKKYNKVLVNSVIQYLKDLNEVSYAFSEIFKKAEENSIILIAGNPDKTKLNEYLSGYDNLELSELEKNKKKETVCKTLWLYPDELKAAAEKTGFKAEIKKMNENIWHSWYMFDMVLMK